MPGTTRKTGDEGAGINGDEPMGSPAAARLVLDVTVHGGKGGPAPCLCQLELGETDVTTYPQTVTGIETDELTGPLQRTYQGPCGDWAEMSIHEHNSRGGACPRTARYWRISVTGQIGMSGRDSK